ncbi:hypothetical protein [Actinomadura sp. 7K507]|uniref:hypothetical protein n=1 Tax=Actinomadura sp. 7K507 TaxID=2530365 RepID=UPI001051443A|nr:hypothetical protein [Actinomadura sp. 7K507]TDC79141.1 hypothetical protein E1285_36575 [Actinomadura sp. 7K507]
MPRENSLSLITENPLRPYISLLFLECTNEPDELIFDQPDELAFDMLMSFMRSAIKSRENRTYTLLGAGFNDGLIEAIRSNYTSTIDQIDGFIYKLEAPPSWVTSESIYIDTTHSLVIALRRGRMFAIHCEAPLREKILNWMKREPRPPFSQVSRSVLQGAFLRGEAKGLWLRGTHTRSAIRPDTKHITGMRVEDALNPLEDSSFAMAAVRTSITEDATSTALLGSIGASPGKGFVWNRRSQDFYDFIKASAEALELLGDTVINGTPLDRPFPILAVETHDLTRVHSAYDILTVTPDELPTSTDITDEMIEAAEILGRASFNIIGEPSTANFKLEVETDDSFGTIRGTTHMRAGEATFEFQQISGSAPSITRVLNALKRHDLLAVYYDSGHAIAAGGIATRNINFTPFENWRFLSFSGFDITVEKPGNTPKEIHANIGSKNDTSLFGWVSRHYSSGWLICDDGPGEAADFVHLSHDGVLSLIHVKAAHSSSPHRGIAVSAYEVVTGQAAKNGRLLADLVTLGEVLQIPQKQRECASWIDGLRVADRTEFLDMLECISPSDRKQVVIVQPHISRKIYDEAQANRDSHHTRPRLSSLETLLHTTRGAIVALGADLQVVGSQR